MLTTGYLWAFAILGLGYVFRAAEHSACLLEFKDHVECDGKGSLFTSDNGEVRMRQTTPYLASADLRICLPTLACRCLFKKEKKDVLERR